MTIINTGGATTSSKEYTLICNYVENIGVTEENYPLFIAFGKWKMKAHHYREAIKTFKKCIDFNKKKEARRDLLVPLRKSAIALTKLGDYQRALYYHHECLNISAQIKSQKDLADTHYNIAHIYELLGEHEKAKSHYSISFALYPTNDGDQEYVLANLALNQSEFCTSQMLAEKSYTLAQDVHPSDHPYVIDCLVQLGEVYAALRDNELANYFYTTALKRVRDTPQFDVRELAKICIKKASFLTSLGHYEASTELYRTAFNQLAPHANIDFPDSTDLLPQEVWIMEIFFGLAENYEKQKLYRRAMDYYQATLHLIYRISRDYTTDISWLQLSEYSNRFHTAAVSCAYKLFRTTSEEQWKKIAFTISQNSTSFLLRKKTNYKSTAEKNKNDTLISRYNNLSNLLSPSAQSNSITTTFDTNKIKIELSLIKDSINENYQDQLTSVIYDSNVEEIQSHINRSECIAKYLCSDTSAFLFLLTRENLSFIRLNNAHTIHKNVTQFKEIYHINALDSLTQNKLFLASTKLYQELIDPFKKNVGPEIKHMIIVPDKWINWIPFSTLVSDKSNPAQPQYAIGEYMFSYLLSLPHWLKMKEKKEKISTDLIPYLGLAIGHFQNASDILVQDTFENSKGKKLIPLPFSKQEVLYGQNTFEGKAFLDASATRAHFLQYAPVSDIIHLATHAYIEPQGAPSFIVLSTPNLEPDALSNVDVESLPLHCSLALLSACHTADGPLLQGEGVMSLARSFIIAGSQSVVASRWSLSDDTSLKIVSNFHWHLKNGDSRAVALHRAKLDFLTSDELSSPYTRNPIFWGSLSLIGDWAPLYEKSPSKPDITLVILALAIIVLILFFVFYSRKSHDLQA